MDQIKTKKPSRLKYVLIILAMGFLEFNIIGIVLGLTFTDDSHAWINQGNNSNISTILMLIATGIIALIVLWSVIKIIKPSFIISDTVLTIWKVLSALILAFIFMFLLLRP